VRLTAGKLPRDTGPAGWNALLDDPPPPRVVDDHLRADWLVVGAGFAGLAAARRLSQLAPGDQVVVLEAGRLAEGPAGRNSGFMIDMPHELNAAGYAGDVQADRRQIEMNRLAIDFAREAAAENGLDREVFDPCGKVNAAAGEPGERHNADYAEHLDRLEEPYRLIDRDGMQALAGSGYYRGGLYTAGTAIIQPAAFIRGVAAGLPESVVVFENSPVLALDKERGAWCATTPEGSVTALKVILAVNGHAESFGFYRRRLMHVFTYASMTRALTASEVRELGGEPTWSFTPADPVGTTVRRISGRSGDRILVRNRFTYDPSMQITERRLAAVAQAHDRSFARRFPMLTDVDMAYRWGGRLCLSWNSVPAFGELAQNLFSACCQNGLGTVKGTLAGMLAAELGTGHDGPVLRRMLKSPRPRKLPPEPLAWLGVNGVMRWKEYLAGEEL